MAGRQNDNRLDIAPLQLPVCVRRHTAGINITGMGGDKPDQFSWNILFRDLFETFLNFSQEFIRIVRIKTACYRRLSNIFHLILSLSFYYINFFAG
jgi:hypothetical protein